MTTNAGFARAEMFIRKPIQQVFEAFVEPDITTRFWFTKSTGRLDENTKVEWTWEMYNYTAAVTVKAIARNASILIEWGDDGGTTKVEWKFRSLGDGTFVSITESGFDGSGDNIISRVRDSTEGFTLVLAGLKALLEHNVRLNLVGDRFPPGLT